eukprot:gene1757-33169_t
MAPGHEVEVRDGLLHISIRDLGNFGISSAADIEPEIISTGSLQVFKLSRVSDSATATGPKPPTTDKHIIATVSKARDSPTEGRRTGAEAGSTTEAVQQASSINCSGMAVALAASLSKSTNAKKHRKEDKRKVAHLIAKVAQSLIQNGYAVCDNYVPAEIVGTVRQEIQVAEPMYEAGEIWVGKGAEVGAQIAVQDVRGDKVLWLEKEALAATAFVRDGKRFSCNYRPLAMVLKSIDELIMESLPKLVPELKGLAAGGRSDAMMAIYPGAGARFAKHIDNTAMDGRRLTCLCYLNNGWTLEQGGALRLFPTLGRPPVDVLPLGGRIAMFWSKDVAHEVMPTFAMRHSFTLWYFDGGEKAEALAAAKIAAECTSASTADQQLARTLIRDILAQDIITATPQGCAILRERVKTMSSPALSVVAAVVGASTPQLFMDAANSIDPEGLAMLRDELSRMGLGNAHAPTAI